MRSTGVGIIESDGVNHRGLMHGVIKNPQSRPHSLCLDHLHTEIIGLIDQFDPAIVAVEGVFHFRNVKTAIILGQARGAVLAALPQELVHLLPDVGVQRLVGVVRVASATPRGRSKGRAGDAADDDDDVIDLIHM